MIFRGQTSADPLVQGPRQTPDLQVTNIFTQNIWHQGSTNFGILPSQMGEHGITLENMENIENMYKHEADCQKQSFYASKHSIYDSKLSICQLGDSQNTLFYVIYSSG